MLFFPFGPKRFVDKNGALQVNLPSDTSRRILSEMAESVANLPKVVKLFQKHDDQDLGAPTLPDSVHMCIVDADVFEQAANGASLGSFLADGPSPVVDLSLSLSLI